MGKVIFVYPLLSYGRTSITSVAFLVGLPIDTIFVRCSLGNSNASNKQMIHLGESQEVCTVTSFQTIMLQQKMSPSSLR